jgi:hypothetical protein
MSDEPTNISRVKEWLKSQNPSQIELHRLRKQVGELRNELSSSLEREENLRRQIEYVIDLATSEEEVPPVDIKKSSKVENAVAVAVASDWHIEEKVDPDKVAGRNIFNLEVAAKRVENFFQGIVWLLDLHCKGPANYKVDTLVLAVLGDLITGYIHEDGRRSNLLSPTQASLHAMKLLESGINTLLKKTKLKLVIPCVYGNHGRTSEKPLVAQAAENSYEWMVYKVLEDKYKNEKRVTFHVANGAFLYQRICGLTIRWHHGDYIKYGGGVGGVSIPLRKAIDSWSMEKKADLSIIGHWHQMLDGNDFLINSSLIGYSPYSRRIKARWEPPRQAFFLIDGERGKRCVSPIYVDNAFLWNTEGVNDVQEE